MSESALCTVCKLDGIKGVDLFPYLISHTPPVHHWDHPACQWAQLRATFVGQADLLA